MAQLGRSVLLARHVHKLLIIFSFIPIYFSLVVHQLCNNINLVLSYLILLHCQVLFFEIN